MRRLFLVALAMIFAAFLPLPVAAASQDDAEAAQWASSDSGPVLRIDNNTLYPGMDKPYDSGYIPSVTEDAATIILPLLSRTTLMNNSISVNVDPGNPESSPFVFENLNQTVPLEEHVVDDGARTQEGYLIDLILPLTEDAQPGRYPVRFGIQGMSEDGTAFSQEFTVYVTIEGTAHEPEESPTPPPEQESPPDNGPVYAPSGGSDSSSEESVPQETEPAPQPKLMVSGFSVDPSPLIAGQEFVLSVDLRNTNKQVAMRNVLISISGETNDAVSAGDSGSFYFGAIQPEETVNVSARMLVQPGITTDSLRVLIHADYEGAKRAAFTSDESLTLQVCQPTRVEMDEINIPAEANAGDTLSIPVNVMNMGRSAVYNVRVQIEAPGFVPEGSLFLGNLESGASEKGELYVFVDMISADGESENPYGETAGRVVLTYENALSETDTQVMEFSTVISPPIMLTTETATEEPEEEKTASGQWWISVIIAAAALGTLVILSRMQKRHKSEDDDASE